MTTPTPVEFREACALLLGEYYTTTQAADLFGARSDSIRDWTSGRRDVPPGVWEEILSLLRIRHERIGSYLETMTKPGAGT